MTGYRALSFMSVRSEAKDSQAMQDVSDHQPVPPAALLLIPHVRPEEVGKKQQLDVWAVVTHVTISCAQMDQRAN